MMFTAVRLTFFNIEVESFTQRSHSLLRSSIPLALFHCRHSSWHAQSAACAVRNFTVDKDVSTTCLQQVQELFEVFNLRAFAVRCPCEPRGPARRSFVGCP